MTMVATDLHRLVITVMIFGDFARNGGRDGANNSKHNTFTMFNEEDPSHESVRGVSDFYKARWFPATIESVVEWTEAVLQGDCGRT